MAKQLCKLVGGTETRFVLSRQACWTQTEASAHTGSRAVEGIRGVKGTHRKTQQNSRPFPVRMSGPPPLLQAGLPEG